MGVSDFNCSTPICDFESGDCGWTTTGTPSSNTFEHKAAYLGVAGGLGDHTFGSNYGHVMFDRGGDKGTSASLLSPPLADLQMQCFTFWFLRGGPNVDLTLQMHHTTSDKYDLIWQSNASHLANEWIRIQNTVTITDAGTLVLKATQTGKRLPFRIGTTY